MIVNTPDKTVTYVTLYFDNLKLWIDAAEELFLTYTIKKERINSTIVVDKYPKQLHSNDLSDKVNDNGTVMVYIFTLDMPV